MRHLWTRTIITKNVGKSRLSSVGTTVGDTANCCQKSKRKPNLKLDAQQLRVVIHAFSIKTWKIPINLAQKCLIHQQKSPQWPRKPPWSTFAEVCVCAPRIFAACAYIWLLLLQNVTTKTKSDLEILYDAVNVVIVSCTRREQKDVSFFMCVWFILFFFYLQCLFSLTDLLQWLFSTPGNL